MRVGSQEWASRTQGKLRARDYGVLIGQVGAQVTRLPGGVVARMGSVRRLNDLRPPRDPAPSEIVTEAVALCRHAEQQRRWIYDHSIRTFKFAQLFAEADEVEYDCEILCVAAMLHDIALCDGAPRDTGSRCFAVRSACVARELARQYDWPEARADRLAEAISIHINPRVTRRTNPEGYLIHHGSSLDVGGTRYRKVRSCALATVLRDHPRGDIANQILEAWSCEADAATRTRTRFLRRPLHLLVCTSPLSHATFPECET